MNKNKNIKSAIVSVAISVPVFLLLLLPIQAYAGELVVLIEGVRSLTVGTDIVSFGDRTTSVHDQLINGIGFGPLGMVIDDMEVGKASWSVSVSANDFTDGTNAIAYNNISVKGDSDGIIDVTDGRSGTDGITVLGNYVPFEGSGDFSNGITIISADNRNRSAEFTIHPEMQLNIPGGTLAGGYSNTLTVTFLVN